MAKRKRSASGFQGQGTSRHAVTKKEVRKKATVNRLLTVGVVVIVLGLVTAGMAGVLGGTDQGGTAHAGSLQLSAEGGEVVSLEEGASLAALEHTVTDRETRYLGADNDPGSLSLAEAGQLGAPTLVWFHADWCHVCQQIRPEVVDLGEQYDGQINFVRINIGRREANEARARYAVRATPTFALLDADGQILANVPGWPGYQAIVAAFDQLLSRG